MGNKGVVAYKRHKVHNQRENVGKGIIQDEYTVPKRYRGRGKRNRGGFEEAIGRREAHEGV